MSEAKSFICSVIDEALNTFDDEEELALTSSTTDYLLPLFNKSSDETPSITTSADDAAVTPSTTTSSANPAAKNTSTKKRKLAEDTAESSKPEKPRRPLSAYNLFFRYERDNIVSEDKDPNRVEPTSPEEKIAHIRKVTMNQLKLQQKKRRPHRKTHGKISFGDLAKTIAEKWKSVDSETKSLFEELSQQDKLRYKEELKEWNEKHADSEEAAAPPPPKKQKKKKASPAKTALPDMSCFAKAAMGNPNNLFQKSQAACFPNFQGSQNFGAGNAQSLVSMAIPPRRANNGFQQMNMQQWNSQCGNPFKKNDFFQPAVPKKSPFPALPENDGGMGSLEDIVLSSFSTNNPTSIVSNSNMPIPDEFEMFMEAFERE